MDPIRSTELLPVPLGPGAREEKLTQLIALNTALQSEKEARFEDNRAHTKKIKQYEEEIQDVLDNTAQQIEMQPVDVLTYPNPDDGTVRRVRADNEALIEERAMTDAEREKFGIAPAEKPEAPAKGRRGRGKKQAASPPLADGEFAEVDGEEPPANLA
jgi:hypothetical protein